MSGWKQTPTGLYVPDSVDTRPPTCVAPGPLGDPGPRGNREPKLLGFVPFQPRRTTCLAESPVPSMRVRGPEFISSRYSNQEEKTCPR